MPFNLMNGCGFVGSHGPDRLVEAGMKLADAASVSTSVNGCGAPRRSLSGSVVHAQAVITKAGSASAADQNAWAIYSVLWCWVQGVVRSLAGRVELARWLAARPRRSQLLAAALVLTSAAAHKSRWSAASDRLLQVNPQTDAGVSTARCCCPPKSGRIGCTPWPRFHWFRLPNMRPLLWPGALFS